MGRNKKSIEKIKKRIIFYTALLSIYFILTAMAAFVFEYYTVTVTKGQIIFSLSMSWQVMLFAAELVTIALQGAMLILIMKSPSHVKYMVLKISGAAAGIFAFAAVVYLVAADGLKLYPTLIFFVYMVVIAAVRTFLIPHSVSCMDELLKDEKKQVKP